MAGPTGVGSGKLRPKRKPKPRNKPKKSTFIDQLGDTFDKAAASGILGFGPQERVKKEKKKKRKK